MSLESGNSQAYMGLDVVKLLQLVVLTLQCSENIGFIHKKCSNTASNFGLIIVSYAGRLVQLNLLEEV